MFGWVNSTPCIVYATVTVGLRQCGRLISPAKIVSCYMRCASHVDPRWCISRAASWGRPEHRVFTPWWDWPQSGPVVTWRPRPVFQFGSRLCQVGGCHSTFQCRRFRRTIVLPAHVRQFCVLSSNCAPCVAVLSLSHVGLSVGCCWHARS